MRYIAVVLIVLVAASVIIPAVEKRAPLGILAVVVIVAVLLAWRRPAKGADPTKPEGTR